MKESLIIYGGSFDPPHNGHAEIAKAAVAYLQAPLVFVPANKARWKQNEASQVDRLSMIGLLVNGLNKSGKQFSLSDFEIASKSEGPSYSIDTVVHFKEQFSSLYFIIGGDQVNLFDQWKEPDTIASMAKIYYVGRPGDSLNEENISRFHMKRLPFKELAVSSSAIRDFQSIDYPDAIRNYVEANRLYYFKEIRSFLKPTRLNHSISVANLAVLIARSNPSSLVDPFKAYKAGLLHDIGKYLPYDQAKEMVVKRFSKEFASYPSWALHQWVGSCFAQDRFGVSDGDILNAIAYHCTGRPKMSPLKQIIYSADKIDPTRDYDSKKLIDGCLKDYHQGFLDVLRANREFLGCKKEKADGGSADSCDCYDYYLNDTKGNNQ